MPAAAEAPATTDTQGPNDPNEGHIPHQTDDFNTLLKHMETTLGTPEPQQAPVEDTRPVDPPKAKKETPPAKEKAKALPQPTTASPPAPEPEPEVTSPKAADWKKLKADRDDWQKKATEHETTAKAHTEKLTKLEQEYNEYKTKTSVKPEEVEAIKKERDTYVSQLERHALAETPKFKDHYNSRFEAATSRALDAVGKDKGDQIKAVLEAPKSAWRKGILNELLEGMESQVDKLNLVAAVNEYDQARDERGKAIDNHKEHLRAWQENQRKEAQEKEERATANRKIVLANTLKAAEQFDAFKEMDDDAEHNLAVARNKKLVEDFIVGGTLPDEVVLMMPILAKQGEHLQKKVPQLEAKITELTEALAKYQGAAPELGGSGEPVHEGDKAKSYVEQVMEAWPGTQQQR